MVRRRRGHNSASRCNDVNRQAVFFDTKEPHASDPLRPSTCLGGTNWPSEAERFRSTYNVIHNNDRIFASYRGSMHMNCKPSSMNLFASTNDVAENLTGQTLPLHAYKWKSETQDNFDGKVVRLSNMAKSERRIISAMDNEEPLFSKTFQSSLQNTFDRKDTTGLDNSTSTKMRPCGGWGGEGDNYNSTYAIHHRPFTRDERLLSNDRLKVDGGDTSSWMELGQKLSQRPPTPSIVGVNSANMFPSEAQLATLPHYSNPNVTIGKSEVQSSFTNPMKAANFYLDDKLGISKSRNNAYNITSIV